MGPSIEKVIEFDYNLFGDVFQITIPKTVKSIERKAFYNCKSIQRILFLSNAQSIEDFSFCGCSSLQLLTYTDSYSIFNNKLIRIPISVKSIGTESFAYCSSITRLYIPSSVQSIGNGAFNECSNLNEITIDPYTTKIEPDAFLNCTSLNNFIFGPSVSEIENYDFNIFGKLTYIKVKKTVKSFQEFPFDNYPSIKVIEIPISFRRKVPNCSKIKWIDEDPNQFKKKTYLNDS